MGDHVQLCERTTRRAELGLQLLVKGGVDEDGLVIRAKEATCIRCRTATRGLGRSIEDHQLRLRVVLLSGVPVSDGEVPSVVPPSTPEKLTPSNCPTITGDLREGAEAEQRDLELGR